MRNLFSALVLFAFITSPCMAADAAKSSIAKSYKYANAEAEYSVLLPEAPTVETVWGDQKDPVPYLDAAPPFGFVGEVASYQRRGTVNADFYDIKITFLKADKEFLKALTPDKMKVALENQVKEFNLMTPKFNVTMNGTQELKWGILTGFSEDANKKPVYHALHYLTGKQSITVIEAQYSLENEFYRQEYDQFAKSISYIQ